MDWIWTIVLFAIFVVGTYLLPQHLNYLKKTKEKPRPGPRALPLIGHLHLFGRKVNQNLHHLAQKHGPVMYMLAGPVQVIVLSSPAAAELFLQTHDLVFASRPRLPLLKQLFYDQRNIIFSQYGSYWRNIRKLCTMGILSQIKTKQFEPMRRAELGLFVSSLKTAAERHETVDVSSRIYSLNGDMTCLVLFGRKYADKDLDEKGFKTVIQDTMELINSPNLGNYFRFMRTIDVQGLSRRAKELTSIFDVFLDRIIDERMKDKINKKDEKGMDDRLFVDTLIETMEAGREGAGFDLDRCGIKAVLLDLIIAAMDTSAVVIEWTLSELIKSPNTLKKLQNELKDVVGMDQLVDESHLNKLQYLDFVVKEGLRLHPAVPLIVRKASEDCVVDGFHIPKGAQLIVNAWSMGRNPSVWQDPEKFMPERYVGNDVDVRGNDFRLIPFGSGRRVCPGMHLGLLVVRLVVAQLVHCFDWELPNNMIPSELDMTEHFGLVTGKKKHLLATPTYRLNK